EEGERQTDRDGREQRGFVRHRSPHHQRLQRSAPPTPSDPRLSWLLVSFCLGDDARMRIAFRKLAAILILLCGVDACGSSHAPPSDGSTVELRSDEITVAVQKD